MPCRNAADKRLRAFFAVAAVAPQLGVDVGALAREGPVAAVAVRSVAYAGAAVADGGAGL